MQEFTSAKIHKQSRSGKMKSKLQYLAAYTFNNEVKLDPTERK